MKKFATYFSKTLPVVVLICLWLSLVVFNFTPDTILSGWDNLHPEFNFFLNVKRSVFAVWQEYQGLGLLGGMGHAADLPRQILLWTFSFFVPFGILRYFWIFAMLLLGPLGIYFLVKRVFLPNQGVLIGDLAPFVSAVFYLFNLATVQYFFTPFETFVSFYGFLPWLIFVSLDYLEKGTKKSLIGVFVVHLLATPSFYVQTLFVVYSATLSFFLATHLFRTRLGGLVKTIKLGLVIFASNAFWLLPVVYFSFTNGNILLLAKQNSIATPETFYMNAERGSVEDIALLKGYWFDYFDLAADGTFDYLYKGWMNHVAGGGIKMWGTTVFVAALLGIAVHTFRKKSWGISLALVALVSYFMLATTNPPFGLIFKRLSQTIPIFSEIFRNVFTKWSVVVAFSYSLGLGLLIGSMGTFSKKARSITAVLLSGLLMFGIFRTTKPVFEGKLISPAMKVSLPQEYDYLFDYFEDKDNNERVAFFPIHTHWGWQFNSWGYRGSGFLWYAIEQPILHRSFDVWSPHNETFYNQASFAVYSKDLASFERVLEKYNVSYLLLDRSVINAGGSEDLLYIDELKQMLSASNNIKLAQKYGLLEIYETNLATDKAIFAPKSFNKVDAELTYAEIDPIYEDKGRYVVEGEGVMYPFVNFDKRQRPNFKFTGKEIVFETEPLRFSSVKFLAKGNLEDESFGEADVKVNEGKRLVATIPVKNVAKEDFGLKRGFSEAKNCDIKELGSVFKENKGDKVVYRAEGGGVSCDYFVYEDLSLSRGYILHIKGENKKGRSLKVYLQNRETKRMDLEELLPEGKFNEYFFILPKDIKGEGYTLNLETRSFGDIASENVLEEIEFIPFPYSWLTSIKLVPKGYDIIQNEVSILSQKKLTPTKYEVEIDSKGGLVVLDQAYGEGWQAFLSDNSALPFLGKRLDHKKVNSWANGWLVPKGKSAITVVYIPQYLEFIGFGMLLITFILLFKPSRKKGAVKSGLTSI